MARKFKICITEARLWTVRLNENVCLEAHRRAVCDTICVVFAIGRATENPQQRKYCYSKRKVVIITLSLQ